MDRLDELKKEVYYSLLFVGQDGLSKQSVTMNARDYEWMLYEIKRLREELHNAKSEAMVFEQELRRIERV